MMCVYVCVSFWFVMYAYISSRCCRYNLRKCIFKRDLFNITTMRISARNMLLFWLRFRNLYTRRQFHHHWVWLLLLLYIMITFISIMQIIILLSSAGVYIGIIAVAIVIVTKISRRLSIIIMIIIIVLMLLRLLMPLLRRSPPRPSGLRVWRL